MLKCANQTIWLNGVLITVILPPTSTLARAFSHGELDNKIGTKHSTNDYTADIFVRLAAIQIVLQICSVPSSSVCLPNQLR